MSFDLTVFDLTLFDLTLFDLTLFDLTLKDASYSEQAESLPQIKIVDCSHLACLIRGMSPLTNVGEQFTFS
jgi:hypothetical protein